MSSANNPSGDSENEADVDLSQMVKELAEEVKKLTSLLSQQAQAQGQQTKDFHKTHAQRLSEIKAQGDMVKENLRYRKSLQETSSKMELFTNMLTKGVTSGFVIKKLASSIGGLSTELDDMKEAQKNYKDFMSKNMTKDLSSDANRPLLEEKMKLKQTKDTAESKFKESKGGQGGVMGKLVGGISSMKKFGDKHAQGLIIGAASASVLIGILKKALDASPMFQQMMKLLNFGIMMVLRPIGDFFGFLFRPILIMLLRKFIIPWYTKMYPFMMKMGQLIGEKLSGAFEALASGDVAGAFAILFEGVDFKKILGDAFSSLRTWITETDWDAVWVAITTALGELGTGLWEHIIKPIGEALYDELIKVDWKAAIWDTIKLLIPVLAVSDFIAGIFGVGNNKWANEWGRALGTWFSEGLAEATTNWNIFWTDAYAWLTGGMSTVTQDWQAIWDNFLDWLNPFTSDVNTNNNNNNNNNQYDPEPNDDPWSWWANGGHITEPMAAVGLRSGRKVMMGEGGNETVIPDSQLGGMGDITINIQSMSGSQQDLNNLRQVILDVIQESSSRRGRT